MSVSMRFHWADYLVMGFVLLVTFGIGLTPAFQSGRKNTTTEFLMGDRKLRLIPVALSQFMSMVSAIMLLGIPTEMYTYGTQQILSIFADAIGHLIVGLYLVPILYPLKLVSTFEYYERRFHSKPLQKLLSLINVFDCCFYYSLAIYSASTALEAVIGLPIWVFVLISGVLVTTYTGLGGIKSAVWTNSFQAIFFLGGILFILFMGFFKAGGLGEVWHRSQQGGRLIFFNTSLYYRERATLWNVVVFKSVFQFASIGIGQAFTQHYASVSSMRAAKIAVLMNIPFFTVLNTMLGLLGLVTYAYYDSVGCDPLRAGAISNSNQILPYFIVDVMQYPGFPGMLVAVFFCCSLSVSSGALASIAANLWTDILEAPLMDKTERTKTMINKLIIVVFSCLAIGMTFLIQLLPGHVYVIAIAVFGGTSGAISGCLILGLFIPFGNAKGAATGVLVSMVLISWVNVGQFLTDPFRQTLPTNVDNCTLPTNTTLPPPKENPEYVFPLYGLSFNWFHIMTTTTSLTVGMLVSLMTGGQDPSKVDEALIIPLGRRFHRFLNPESIKYKGDYEMTVPSKNVSDADNLSHNHRDNTGIEIDIGNKYNSRSNAHHRLSASGGSIVDRSYLNEEDLISPHVMPLLQDDSSDI